MIEVIVAGIKFFHFSFFGCCWLKAIQETMNMALIQSLFHTYDNHLSLLFTNQHVMKSSFKDIIFIIVSAAVLIIINQLGYSEYLSKFSFLVIYLGYIIGKFVGIKERHTKELKHE